MAYRLDQIHHFLSFFVELLVSRFHDIFQFYLSSVLNENFLQHERNPDFGQKYNRSFLCLKFN